jgi:ATP-dependent 26S proteasome regulatory subunit
MGVVLEQSITSSINTVEAIKRKKNSIFVTNCFFTSQQKKQSLDCELFNALRELASHYAKNKQYFEAQDTSFQALQLTPSNRLILTSDIIEILEDLVTYTYRSQDDNAYEQALMMQINLSSSDYSKGNKNALKALEKLSMHYQNNNEIEKAIRITQEIIESPRYRKLYTRQCIELQESLGDLLAKSGDYANADVAFNEALSLSKSQSRYAILPKQLLLMIKSYTLKALQNTDDDALFHTILSQSYAMNLEPNQITFEQSELNTNEKLKKIVALTSGRNLILPDWFPCYAIKNALSHKHENTLPPSKSKTTIENTSPLATTTLNEQSKIEQVPETSRQKEMISKLRIDWTAFGVGGYKKQIKELLTKLFLPRALPYELIKKTGIKPPRGAILYGPPGTGKTLMARTIAEQLFDKDQVIIRSGPELLSRYVGQSTQNTKNLFLEAQFNKDKTYVYIFDEFEALVTKRNEGDSVSKEVKSDITTTLLTTIDGVKEFDNIIVIGITNFIEKLDDALIRDGRLGLHIKVDMPSRNDRYDILQLILATPQKHGFVNHDVDIDLLADRSQGFSGANLKAMVDTTLSARLPSLFKFNYDDNIIELNVDDIALGHIKTKDFINTLESMSKNTTQQSVEIKRLQNQPFCPYSHTIAKNIESVRNQEKHFPYIKPMLIAVYGDTGYGKSAFSLNLFPNTNYPIYLKGSTLTGCTIAQQKKIINEKFRQALSHEDSLLILDNLEDCLSDTNGMGVNKALVIYLKDKLKMTLENKSKLRVIITAKNKGYTDSVFHDNIDFNAVAYLPPIQTSHEIIQLAKTLGFSIKSTSPSNKIINACSVEKIKHELLKWPDKENFDIDMFITNSSIISNKKQTIQDLHHHSIRKTTSLPNLKLAQTCLTMSY